MTDNTPDYDDNLAFPPEDDVYKAFNTVAKKLVQKDVALREWLVNNYFKYLDGDWYGYKKRTD